MQSALACLVQWSPPCSLFTKLNVDASWAAATGNGYIGVIARNDEGQFLAARKLMIKALSIAVTEALPILCSCKLASSLGLEMIIVESDSKENISCLLNASSAGSWETFPNLGQNLAAWGILSGLPLVLGLEIGQHGSGSVGVEKQYEYVWFHLG